jgi:putative methylase
MNPPFGAQNKHADRPFIDKACEIGLSIYGIHNGGTEEFLRRYYSSRGFVIKNMMRTSMDIPHRFHFHSKETSSIEVLIVHCVRSERVHDRS